jgi:hypothetical protein
MYTGTLLRQQQQQGISRLNIAQQRWLPPGSTLSVVRPTQWTYLQQQQQQQQGILEASVAQRWMLPPGSTLSVVRPTQWTHLQQKQQLQAVLLVLQAVIIMMIWRCLHFDGTKNASYCACQPHLFWYARSS